MCTPCRYGYALAVAALTAAPACGLEDAPLARIDVADFQAVDSSEHEGHQIAGSGPDVQAAQPSAPTAPTGEQPAAGQPAPSAAAAGPTSSDITVEITSNGFGGVPKGFTLTVKRGSRVRIKFVNSDTTGDNVHIIAFSGLSLPETELSAAKPSGTVEFSADTPGRYGFSCQNQWCTIHPKLKGTLIVEE